MLPSPEDSKKKSGTTREKKGQIWWTPQPIKVKMVFFQHQATPKKNFPNSSLWIYEATFFVRDMFFLPAALDRQITTSQVQRFSSFWFGGTAMGLFQNLFVSFRLRGSFLEEDMTPEDSGQKSTWSSKKMEKRCWAHSGQPFLAVGFGSHWVFSQSLFGNSPAHHEKCPKMRCSTPIENCWKIYEKKMIQLSPCFCPWFFSLRIYHFWTAPVIELMNRHQGTCIKISHLQFLDTTTGQIVVGISIWRHPRWTQRQVGVFLKRLKVIMR